MSTDLFISKGLEAIMWTKPGKDDNHQPHPAQRRLRVFLGHSHEDKEAVRPIYHWLHDCGVEPWFDAENILPGQDWELEITKAVKNNNVVIFCLRRPGGLFSRKPPPWTPRKSF